MGVPTAGEIERGGDMRWAAQQLKLTCMASHGHCGGYSDGIQTIMAVE